MQHILVTTDFSPESEAAFPMVKELLSLLKPGQGSATLVSVMEDLGQKSAQFQFALAVLESHGIREQLRQEAEAQLEETRQKHFDGLPVGVELLRATKPVHREIIDYSKQNAVDLIVVATHGRTGVSHVLLGSVSEKLVRESPIPILVVPVPQEKA
ncbi:MAG: universal stress protein [Bdellovibrionales bacterium]|nr:universal stress protein [Bdellovibrionales bacterium]